MQRLLTHLLLNGQQAALEPKCSTEPEAWLGISAAAHSRLPIVPSPVSVHGPVIASGSQKQDIAGMPSNAPWRWAGFCTFTSHQKPLEYFHSGQCSKQKPLEYFSTRANAASRPERMASAAKESSALYVNMVDDTLHEMLMTYFSDGLTKLKGLPATDWSNSSAEAVTNVPCTHSALAREITPVL